MLATSIRTSAAARRLGSEGAFETLARVRELQAQGRDIVSLFVGEPDFDTPEHVKAAAVASLERNETHYTPSAGILPLRAAIAEFATRFRGLTPAVTPDEVVVGPGLKPLIWNVLCSLVEPGDEVVFADPAYPAYASCTSYLNAVPVRVPLHERYEFRLDLDEVAAAITPRTRLLVLNSPHNPTGGVLTRADLEHLAQLAIRHDLTVLSDEIYCRNVYDGAFFSILSLDGMRERTILLDGFSKAYAMTGWRLGYAVMPAALARTVALMGQNTYSCTAAFVQAGGVAALEGPDEPVGAMVEEFRRRRERIVRGLNDIPGITCRLPAGTFYVFPNITAITPDDRELASYLLEEAGVAALAGTCFGPAGRGYLRLSYATSLGEIERALERMRAAVPNFKR